MRRTKNIIKLPERSPQAFNPNRPAGALLLAQVAHLHKALVKLHGDVEALLAIDPAEVDTEGEVADYARRVTELLHNLTVKPDK